MNGRNSIGAESRAEEEEEVGMAVAESSDEEHVSEK